MEKVNDKLYAIGGFNGSTLATVEEYNPADNTWTSKASMPTPRRMLVVASVNNKIYAIGGMNFTDANTVTYSNATEEYDPLTNTWASKAAFPMPPAFNSVLGNAFIGGAAALGKIYIFVFNTNIHGTTATYEYDPVLDKWDTTKAPVPFSYTRYSAVSVNDKVYVLSTDHDMGMTENGSLAEYDPKTDSWTIKPATSTHLSLTSLAAAQNKLYAVGGLKSTVVNRINRSNVSATVDAFDLSLNQWIPQIRMPTARYSAGVGTVADEIYVIGGADITAAPLSTVEKRGVQIQPTGLQVGGIAVGLRPSIVLCENLTTGQRVQVTVQRKQRWNCKTDGLSAKSGDLIRQTVTGDAN
ncbi:MAG: hypothetical protein PHE55_13455 [Methylococcaceae bacterium]|nr:hypothetical protein [Methylococcaceae bacterium]